MKKHLFLFAAAALALASCSSDETIAENQGLQEANEISFQPTISGITRAANDYGVKSAWETGDKLYVNAIRTVSATRSLLFQDQFDKDGTGFNSTTKHYWPTDLATNNIYFTAFWGVPYKTITNYANNDEFKLNADYTVDAVGSQMDIMYAQSPAYSSKPNSNGSVVLNFRHMLSQIIVQVANSEANLDIDVSGVMIGGVYSKGTFQYTGTETSTAATTGGSNVIPIGSWSSHDVPTEYIQTTSTSPAITQKSPTTNQASAVITGYTPLILMPQLKDAATSYLTPADLEHLIPIGENTEPEVNGSYIALKMVIKDHATQTTLVSERWCVWPIAANWYPGYKYTYTVNAGSGGYQPIDQNGDTELDPVLGGSFIWFSPSCTIDVWAEGNIPVSQP